MSSEKSSWVPTPRQYRPTYTRLSTSVSTSNFGSPFQRTATQVPPKSKHRRNTSIFPTIDHLHSAPTVASSGLTASVSNNDISNPTLKQHRLSLQPRTRTPTRIPTPIPHIKVSSPMRSISSPAAPQKSKENILPTTHRLLGPIQPGLAPNPTLTRSRTMNVLSNLTSTFTRSTHSLSASRTSYGNLSQPSASSLCVSALTLNIRQITHPMPPAYWLGRFQALHDHFRNDHLTPDFLSSGSGSGSSSDSTSPLATNRHFSIIHHDGNGNGNGENDDDDHLSRRIFAHLEALCTNHEARKSFKAFQQAYARRFEREALLPLGGCMVDREQGFIAKAGRLFSGGRKSGFGVGVGVGGAGVARRSTLGGVSFGSGGGGGERVAG